MSRFVCVLLFAAFTATSLAAQPDVAGYPIRPIRLVVGQSAGGNADLVARTYAHFLGERLGQQVVVDNRPGAGGLIATELVPRAARDGHTLLGPAKMPQAIANRLSREVMEIARSPELRRRLLAEGLEPLGTTPQELDAHIAAEIDKWARVIKVAGLAPQ